MKKRARHNLLFRLAIFTLVILSLASCAYMFYYNRYISYFLIPPTIILVVFVLVSYFSASRNMHRYIAEIDSKINLLEKQSLYDMPVPVLIVGADRQILWYNTLCKFEVLDMLDAYGMSLDIVTQLSLDELSAPDGVEITYNNRTYRTYARSSNDSESNDLQLIYFLDLTAYHSLRKEYHLSRPAVALIIIDNYEELLQNIKESEKAQILSKLELLLENFIDQTSGVLYKLSSARFMAVFEERDLVKMVEGRFEVLDKARQIMVNERMGATLSIGVGRGAPTLEANETLAKQALDMALGRGGDQASIKTESAFEFFGGISKGIEKHTKVKTRIIASALCDLIDTSDRVLVMGHRFGDLDSLGASIGLVSAIRNMGKDAYIAIDSNKNLAASLMKRMMDNGNSDYFITPDASIELSGSKSLLIIVDTHNPHFLESQALYKNSDRVVVIDHHRKMVGHIENAVIFHHEPYASSASEMVAELLQYFGESGRISPIAAEALLAGIMLDTKSFVMRTGVRTFEAAAFLRKLGADTISVRTLFSSSIDSYQKRTRLVSSAEIYRKCAISFSDFTSQDLQIIAPQAADELLSISGVDASFVLYELNEVIYLSARSMGKLNVQLIMEALGGGGHHTMAGAQIDNSSIENARQLLLESIDNYYDNKRDNPKGYSEVQ